VWLGEADQSLGICEALAACIPDWRRGPVLRTLPTLVRQRIFQIASGYADQNDATTLRTDPLLKAVCGRLPESGADLASQPSLSRLENAVDRHACAAMAEAVVTLYIRERQRRGAPTHLVLDVDGTDDAVHGHQEGGAYHGFYRKHIDHPLVVFDGQTDQLITAVLRPGRCHESRFVVLVPRRLLKRLCAVWPEISIKLRADSGFAVPRLSAWCEANGLTYTIGMIPDRRLAVMPPSCSPGRWPRARNTAGARSGWPARQPIKRARGSVHAAWSTKPKPSVKDPIHALSSPAAARTCWWSTTGTWIVASPRTG
jgi:Transposase DDE domain group 1